MKKLLLLLIVPFALVLVPPVAHASCTTPDLPVVGCALPGPTDSPTPTQTPQPSPTPGPTFIEASPAALLTSIPMASTPPGQPPLATPDSVGGVVLTPGAMSAASLPAPVFAVPTRTAALPATVSPLSGVVASSFAIVVFGLLTIPLLLSFLAGLRPGGSAQPSYGGTVMKNRTRLWTGLSVLAAAAVVGGVGWYRVSGEPLLNRQIPFLASAGIVVVLLSVLGGSLIIAEQLRGDQNRIGELEDAVRALTEALAPSIENAPRLEATEVLTTGRGRSRRAGVGTS